MSPGCYTELFFLDEAAASPRDTDLVPSAGENSSTPFVKPGSGLTSRLLGAVHWHLKWTLNYIARGLTPND